MSLDRGERVEINSVKSDRSSEYIDSIKASISLLKKEESLVKERILEAKDDLKRVQDQGAVDISNKQKQISDLNVKIQSANSVLIEMDKRREEVIADYVKQNKQMNDARDQVEASIVNKITRSEAEIEKNAKIVDNLVIRSSELGESIDVLIGTKNALTEEVKKLADNKTAMISIIDGLSVDAKELSEEVDSLNADIDIKKAELAVVSKNYTELNKSFASLKSELDSMAVEKQNILDAKEENTRRAKELQEMYEDVRIEKIAQANKNASLLKREQAIKDAQTKIGG